MYCGVDLLLNGVGLPLFFSLTTYVSPLDDFFHVWCFFSFSPFVRGDSGGGDAPVVV